MSTLPVRARDKKELAGERRSLTKNDMHLNWNLPNNIVIVLCFNCHGRF